MTDEIKNTTPLWWEIQNLPTELIRELRRRKNTNNVGMSIPSPYANVTFDFQNNYKKYKGPMTSWVRVFSNSTGKPLNILTPPSEYLIRKNDSSFSSLGGYDGFILRGGDGFYDAFGYDNNSGLKDKNAIIGYQANGLPHYLNGNVGQFRYETKFDSNFPQNNSVPRILPPPGVTSVTIKQSKEFLTYATVKFKCYSLAQLEYLTPFFLNPGINLFVEFGWNLFNQKSLINLSDPNDCWKIISKPQTALELALDSNGNYGCVTGIITSYKFGTTDGFAYDCDVEMTSRQGLYAGMKTDNIVITDLKKDTQNDFDSNVFLNLKNFCKIYLPSINDVIRTDSNFYDYIVKNFELISDKYSESNKSKEDAKANAESIKLPISNTQPSSTDKNQINKNFYDGKPEDRVFTGRRTDVYKKSKSCVKEVGTFTSSEAGDVYREIPGLVGLKVIEYKLDDKTKQISFFDENDFDAQDNNDEVWLQLGFVFEMFNLFMSNGVERFKIDINNIVINAHPNLMSLNKDFLIPNPVSPKINKGRTLGIDPKTKKPTGYLKNDASLSDKNKYLNLKADLNLNDPKEYTIEEVISLAGKVKFNNKRVESIFEKQRKKEPLTAEDGLLLSSYITRKKFKTAFYERDNIDTLINYLYYKNNDFGSAAFPFVDKEKTVGSIKYKPYYYGYFKNLLISKTKLIDIVTDSNTNNYKDTLRKLLEFINSSVDNFWKLEIVDNPDGGLSIVDKNGVGIFDEIYMFDIGGGNNVIRSINFDVNTSNEQAINVLFGGSVDKNLTTQLKEQISNANNQTDIQAIYSRLTTEPPLRFVDRMDKFELENFLKNQSGSINTTVAPGTPSGLVNDNNDIAYLQTYGRKHDVLTMQVKFGTCDDTNVNSEPNDSLNIKFLNWPESMRGMLRSILTDGDIYNNVKYSGVADNFQLTVVFDGMFGFRNLQCFAISNLPKPYVPGSVIFQVLEVEHSIESGKWITSVTALIRSVGGKNYKYIPV